MKSTKRVRNRPSPIVQSARFWAALALMVMLAGCGQQNRHASLDQGVIEAMNQGVAFMGQYDYDQAVRAFEKVVAAAPALVDAKINLAISLFNRSRKEDQDLDRAGKMLNEVLARDPANTRALYCKGIILQHLGNAQEAVACFEKVTRARPDDGVAWYLLGLCQQRIGQPAEESLLRAIRLRPGLYSAYYQLYQAALRTGQTEKARSFMNQFMSLRESPLAESVELPQYNQMGDLALALPIAPQSRPITKSRVEAAPAKTVFESDCELIWRGETAAIGQKKMYWWDLGGLAAGDFDLDGRFDLIVTAAKPDSPGRLVLLKAIANEGFADTTAGSGLEKVRGALSCAIGDFDNDGKPDVFVACAGDNHLLKGNGDGTFVDVTRTAGIAGSAAVSLSALFVDADHDGDLDIFVCNVGNVDGAGNAGNQLLNNNGNGTFSDITAKAGLACSGSKSVMALFGDVDGDRDADLLVLCAGAPARLFLNDLGGRYHEAPDHQASRGDLGGVMQDFNGDGHMDVLALGAGDPQLQLYLGDGHARFLPAVGFEGTGKTAESWGPIRGLRVSDIDLDGDLDTMLFGKGAHILLNTGAGRFVWQTGIRALSDTLAGVELFDLNGDMTPDLLTVERAGQSRISLMATHLTPPSSAFALLPTGTRGRDGRTRSPASGLGVKAVIRAGLHEQTITYTGHAGGPNQSCLPMLAGLGGDSKADYVALQWPDGVAQVELGLGAGTTHKIAELQRKVSSCPVLFAWNGNRFEFVTDFAGVGGLGYYVGPGESAQPQVLEHVRIESSQLAAKDGAYELRVTEPMEEAAYIDRLELLAVDHPATHQVFPDERLVIGGPAPTQKLIAVDKPVFPLRALCDSGADCAVKLAAADRLYAYDPPLDNRYFGFCRRHSLQLDFGDLLSDLKPGEPIFLFIRGYIEYPYSQTVYAAAQSGIKWEPIRVDRRKPDGQWETIVPDAGAPGGIDRTMTIELTGLVGGPTCTLRLTTNLEIGYDQVFVARDAGRSKITVRQIPLLSAELRRAGFAREYSPDGRPPIIYDYDLVDATAAFRTPRGAYTRYGQVTELLRGFDDQYVILAPGDEIALRFDASGPGPTQPGFVRSYVLVSHAWCKDMDLYTAEPQTLEPLPFGSMRKYPYPPGSHFPNTPEIRAYQAEYNTRLIY